MRRRNAQTLIKAGAIVTIGTDNYWAAAPEFSRAAKPDTQNHGIGSILAIEGLVELGMTPAQAIVAATRNGAIASRGLDQFGTIEVGKRADLLILDADPLADIANLRKLSAVIRDGRAIDRERLPARACSRDDSAGPRSKAHAPGAGQPRVRGTALGHRLRTGQNASSCSAVSPAFMWTFGLVMDAVVLPAAIGVQRQTSEIFIEAVSAAIHDRDIPLPAFCPHDAAWEMRRRSVGAAAQCGAHYRFRTSTICCS